MQTIVNLGTGGADLNGQNGSTTSADSNDALFLDWPGDNAGNYVYLPGVASNFLSVPDEAALDITGDIDIRVRVALDDWTPGSNTGLMDKWAGSPNNAWLFWINSGNRLEFRWSADGSTQNIKPATSDLNVSDEESLWVRVTLDVDNGASGNDVKFFTSTDGSSWTQLGSTITTAGTTSINTNSVGVAVGAFTNNAAGKFYRAQVLDGIDGTTVLDVDCSQITSGSDTSFTALTGQTVTINRSTSGRKSVAVVSPLWLFGTDDFMQVADNALLDFSASESFSVFAVIRQWSTPASSGTYVGKFDSSTTTGYELRSFTTNNRFRWDVRDASAPVLNSDSGNTFTYGDTVVAIGVADRSDDLSFHYVDTSKSTTSDISGVGSVATGDPLRIGASEILLRQDFELLSVAVFRRALTATEISALTTYYQNRWP